MTRALARTRAIQLNHVVLCALACGLGCATEREVTVPPPAPPQVDAAGETSRAPLDIPGLSVWLDGERGVTTSARGVETWVDRSPQEHRFVAESALGSLPVLGPYLNGHQAVELDGNSRLVTEPDPSALQTDSLTLGNQGFMLALVFKTDGTPDGPQILTALLGPRFDMSPPEVPPPNPRVPIWLTVGPLGFDAIVRGAVVSAPVALDFSAPHLLLIDARDTQIRVRVDGRDVVRIDCTTQLCLYGDLPYEPLYAGEWDFDLDGLKGGIAELILAKGASAPNTLVAVESYLLDKFNLPLP